MHKNYSCKVHSLAIIWAEKSFKNIVEKPFKNVVHPLAECIGILKVKHDMLS